MNLPASPGDPPRRNRSFGDPLAYYQKHYEGLTRGDLRMLDQSFYECLRVHKLLGLLPGRVRRVIGDPLAYYREHYAGLPRGELQKRDKGLYKRLRRDGLLGHVPRKVTASGEELLTYYRAHYAGVARGELARRNSGLYQAVLAWRLSNTMDVAFCVDALDEALARFGRPEIFNTDQGSQFTSAAFTGRLASAGIRISMDGRGRWMDNVFIERLWRSLKYEDVYLKGYACGREARAGIASWIGFYNGRRPHQALAGRPPMTLWREGVTGTLADNAVDMTLRLDDAAASPTCPRRQPQQQQTPRVA